MSAGARWPEDTRRVVVVVTLEEPTRYTDEEVLAAVTRRVTGGLRVVDVGLAGQLSLPLTG